MRMQHLLGVSIVGIVASAAFGGTPGISSEDVEALIARYQESMTSRQVEVLDQKLEQEAETPRLSVLPFRQPAAQTSWLALADLNEPPPAHKGNSLEGSNDKPNNPGEEISAAQPSQDSATPAGEKSWELKFKIYGWLPTSIDGRAGVGSSTSNLHYNCRDILHLVDELTCLFEGGLEVRVGRWGFIADLLHGRLEDSQRRRLVKAHLSFELTILELAGFYRVGTWTLPPRCGKSISLDFLGGARYIKLGGDAIIGGRHREIDLGGSRDWWDMFVGPRITWQATEKLALFARGDVGGFGIGNSSQCTWQIKGGVEYDILKNVFIELGFRLLDIDYVSGSGSDEFRFDVQMYGPYLGLGVKF